MTKKFVTNSLFLVSSAFILAGCAEILTMSAPMNKQTNEQVKQPPIVQNQAEAEAEIQPVPVKPPIVNYKHVALTKLNLNNQGNQITIKPGTSIQASLNYVYKCPKCDSTLNNQIIIGLAKRSAQACIYNGGPEAQGTANFELKVPAKPGRYEVRFRILQAVDCAAALSAGWGADDTPPKETTIGTMKVTRKTDV